MRKSTLRSLIAILIVAVLTVGVCIVGFVSRNDAGKWFRNFKNISGWHWADKTLDGTDNTDGEDKDPSDDKLVNSGENKGILLKPRRLAVEDF